ncbi:MAG: LytR C-terminal domain-containing protein [Eubacterium sp.]|nr:LytR C-terminal domain-containing protein [Eubacterium sp.]
MASKKKKDSTIGMFFSFFLKASVIILGLVILAMSVYLVKQIMLQKNSEAENKSDEAVFEDDQRDDLMMASKGDADVLFAKDDDKLDVAENKDLGFDAKIVVLNATETAGLAGAWKEKLEEEGFKNVEAGNYTDGVLESSKIVLTAEKTGENLKKYLPEATVETMPADQVPSDVSGDSIAAFFIIGNSDNIIAE